MDNQLMNTANKFHDSKVISLNITSMNYLVDKYLSESGDYQKIEIIVQINSIKGYPIVRINLINCSHYSIDNSISGLIDEIVISDNGNGKIVSINECVFNCMSIEFN